MVQTLPEAYASSDLTYLNLTRLLARLELNILSSSADLKSLQRSPYHRTRVGANIEYARTLLLQLERTIPGIKIPSRKQTLQTDLARKRQAVKVLKERLNEISVEAEAQAQARIEEDANGEGEDGEEDLLGAKVKGSVDEPESMSGAHKAQHDTNGITPTPPQGQDTSHTLRHRHHPSSSATQHPPPTATTATSSSLPTTTPTPSSNPKLQSTESTLDTHLHEQETLTTSLLSLATQLKTSSQSFHSSLESEKSVLARAVEGLDRNTSGMEAAGKRMGMLRRMSEGKGWWGRMMVYLWIFGLWILALGIVFLGPKLRF